MDDRTPLNPARDPSVRSASTGGAARRQYMNGDTPPPMPLISNQMMDNGRAMSPQRRPSRDEYGNLIPEAAGVAVAGEMPPPGFMRREGSRGSLDSNRSRGRGGYGPPGRGRGFGPPRGGGYGPPRGGYGPRGGYRGQPPPPGWYGRGRGGHGNHQPGMIPLGGMARAGPPPEYGNSQQYSPPRNGPPPLDAQQPQSPERHNLAAGAIGQAVEMDRQTGASPGDGALQGETRDGNESMQPAQRESEMGGAPMSPTSIYSDG